MTIFIKNKSGQLNVTGFDLGFPSPFAFVGSLPVFGLGIDAAEVFGGIGADDIFLAYSYDKTGWGALNTTALVPSPPPANHGSPFLANISGNSYRELQISTVSDDLVAVGISFDLALDNVDHNNVMVNDYSSLTAAFSQTLLVARQIGFAGINTEAVSGLMAGAVYEEIPEIFCVAVVFYDDNNLTINNAFAGEYVEMAASFKNGAEYLTIGYNNDVDDLLIVTWTPELYIDLRSGVFTCIYDSLIFDDAEIQADVTAGNLFIYGALVDRFYALTTLNNKILEVFPLTGTYNVWDLVPQNAAAVDLMFSTLFLISYNYHDEQIVFSGLDGFDLPLYGLGSEPVAVYIPRHQPVKLPCFVNCIPLIDRRK